MKKINNNNDTKVETVMKKKLYEISIDVTSDILIRANTKDRAIKEVLNMMDNDELWEYIKNYGVVSIGDVVTEDQESK